MEERSVTYIYPDALNASNLKYIEDPATPIAAWYFTKDSLTYLEGRVEPQCAVYFLFDRSDDDSMKIYVGQSINGVNRIKDHVINKEFWSFGIMFITTNKSFDKLCIDYLEHIFICKVTKSSHIIMNTQQRLLQPNVLRSDMPKLKSYAKEIEFFLNAQGISLREPQPNSNSELYFYGIGIHDSKAKLFIKDGRFVLVQGTLIQRPLSHTISWNSNFNNRYNSFIDSYIKDGKVEENSGVLRLTMNIEFNTPSRPASLVSGVSTNGWKFFEGLEDQYRNVKDIEEIDANREINTNQI